jgi:hypothetical protein
MPQGLKPKKKIEKKKEAANRYWETGGGSPRQPSVDLSNSRPLPHEPNEAPLCPLLSFDRILQARQGSTHPQR